MAAKRRVIDIAMGPEDLTRLGEGFFSKLARSVLREIRVASKEALAARIMAAINAINEKSVVQTWTYQIDQAA